MASNYKIAYKRMETDEEFVARVREKHPKISYGGYAGKLLDDLVWSECQMQRRIVEDAQ